MGKSKKRNLLKNKSLGGRNNARKVAKIGASSGAKGGADKEAEGSQQGRRNMLESFPNPYPGRDYVIEMSCPEFTCVCPMTGQPDFATIDIRYTPGEKCVELKSLKLYLWSYRDHGGFHEAVTNTILDDLVALINPRQMTVTGRFNVRGGITTTVVVSHPNGVGG